LQFLDAPGEKAALRRAPGQGKRHLGRSMGFGKPT